MPMRRQLPDVTPTEPLAIVLLAALVIEVSEPYASLATGLAITAEHHRTGQLFGGYGDGE